MLLILCLLTGCIIKPKNRNAMGRIKGEIECEFRVGKDLKELNLKPKFTANKATFTWKLTKPYVSLRIFVAPSNTDPTTLDESKLTAIVQPNTYDITGLDPIIALKRIAYGVNEAWHISPADADCSYLHSKLANTPQNLKTITKDGTISIPYTTTYEAPMAIFVAAVTPYGEMTPFTKLEKQVPKPEPKPEPAPESASPDGTPMI